MFHLGEDSYAKIGKLGKKFGNIFSIKLGSYWYVVLNDFDTVKSALKENVFAGRPNNLLRLSFYTKGQYKIPNECFTDHFLITQELHSIMVLNGKHSVDFH